MTLLREPAAAAPDQLVDGRLLDRHPVDKKPVWWANPVDGHNLAIDV